MYSFDNIANRVGTESRKWSVIPEDVNRENLHAMWVADMEFKTPDFVMEEIKTRMEHPVLGYFELGEDFYNPIKHWHKSRYKVSNIENHNISYQNTVLGGYSCAQYTLTEEGESMLVNTPCYVGFINQSYNKGRALLDSPLIRDEQGKFIFDYNDMEEKIISNNIKLAILCSPHNPTGRVWTREELERYVSICEKHNVKIISDEIWADFILEGEHIPTHTISPYAKENTISLYSCTKTFNISALLTSYTVIYNKELMEAYEKTAQLTHYNDPNTLSIVAQKGGYLNGADWVDEMCQYIKGNLQYAVSFVKQHLPKVKVAMPEGTYLLWLDFKDMGLTCDEVCSKLHAKGLMPDNGRKYWAYTSVRLNLSTSKAKVEEAMAVLKEVFAD